mgnify:CR=1 FL=1
MVMGEDVGRAGGVFRATAGLRDTLRRGPLRRHAARRGRDPRHARSASAWPAGGPSARCSTTRSRYPCLDQLITHVGRYRWRTGGKMEFPLVDAHAVRRRRARAGAARRLARGVLRAHAGREGGDPVDAGGREGPARRGDPRSRPGRHLRAEAPLPDDARRGAGGRARRPARQGAARARGRRRDARRVRRRWCRSAEQAADALADERRSRCSTSAR